MKRPESKNISDMPRRAPWLVFLCGILLAFVAIPFLTGEMNAKECPDGMAYVSAGYYQKGSSKAVLDYLLQLCNATMENCYPEWFTDEYPRRNVKMKSFCIDKFEYPNERGRLPSYGVDWNNASRMCIAQGKRLCADNEWEKACAGPKGMVWPFGDKYSYDACNIAGKGVEKSGSRAACIGPYGVRDMSGNLSEWTASTRGAQHSEYTEIAPRIVKGGSWKDSPIFTRCAFVDSYDPKTVNRNMGFRCCWP